MYPKGGFLFGGYMPKRLIPNVVLVPIVCCVLLLAGIGLSSSSMPVTREMGLAARNRLYCSAVDGQANTRHSYEYHGMEYSTLIDCETTSNVYATTLDDAGSIRSVTRALFFAELTGKDPIVVFFDTDGQHGPYEHVMRTVCGAVNMTCIREVIDANP